jgi:cytoskeleton protein RodZ
MRLFYVGRLMNDMTMNDSTTHKETDHQQQEGAQPAAPGAQLAAQRQALNWSIEQVANQLNLAPRQIQAIEADNYAALPGMASVRGFIRAYAKLLKIDAAPLLLVIAKETTAADDLMPLRRALSGTPFAESRSPSSSGHLWPSKSTIIVLLFILLIAGIIFVGKKIGWISVASLSSKIDKGVALWSAPMRSAPRRTDTVAAANRPSDTSGTAVDIAPASVVAAPDASNATAVARTNDMADGASPSVTGQVAMNSTAPAAPPKETSFEAPAGDANQAVPAVRASAADTKNMLVLKLREDSWIEIKRPDDTVSISRMAKAGTTEAFKISGPVALTVGNASGVDATLRGRPVELKAKARNNVVRLNLK